MTRNTHPSLKNGVHDVDNTMQPLCLSYPNWRGVVNKKIGLLIDAPGMLAGWQLQETRGA
jgi:hypothetical protein